MQDTYVILHLIEDRPLEVTPAIFAYRNLADYACHSLNIMAESGHHYKVMKLEKP